MRIIQAVTSIVSRCLEWVSNRLRELSEGKVWGVGRFEVVESDPDPEWGVPWFEANWVDSDREWQIFVGRTCIHFYPAWQIIAIRKRDYEKRRAYRAGERCYRPSALLRMQRKVHEWEREGVLDPLPPSPVSESTPPLPFAERQRRRNSLIRRESSDTI